MRTTTASVRVEGTFMLTWKSETRVVVDDVEFVLAPDGIPAGRETAAALTHGLVLRKPRWMVEEYAALIDTRPQNIVELGIYDGGSTALLALLFRPRRLVAVELSPSRVRALDDFVDAHDCSQSVHAHFGIDQADRSLLEEILTREFGGDLLDLVVDDASHLLEPTTASFNTLFPRLRAGGLFVIEDWSWQHNVERTIANALEADERTRDELARQLASGAVVPSPERPLSRLVLEIALTAAYASEIVSEVSALREGWLVVRRGDAEIDADRFDIRECYGRMGAGLLEN